MDKYRLARPMEYDDGEGMSAEVDIKQQVREFYDRVGWQMVDGDLYQNAHYEDLRPVSSEYIHRCHLRVTRHLKPSGRFLLDAGSGPIQYPEYLEYSRGYRFRVCADISIVALQEARKRIGDHGLYVVADVANLPFKDEVFEGVVSLHTIHHLPEEQHGQAYDGLYRVLARHSTAAVVNGWPDARLMQAFNPLVRQANRLRSFVQRRLAKEASQPETAQTAEKTKPAKNKAPKGTFTQRHGVSWIKNEVGGHMPVEIRVWRSVSVRFLRALVHPWLGGRWFLRILFWLEERFPHYFGENGQYPLILINKD
jgi:ubiquinone/menaquinone biosynthesis C-methylase UbiE